MADQNFVRFVGSNPGQKLDTCTSLFLNFFWTSLICKVEFTLLQSIFSRQIFLLYFGKGKFGGKKFTLQKSEFYFANEFFPFFFSYF
jgi:hypothetical protein